MSGDIPPPPPLPSPPPLATSPSNPKPTRQTTFVTQISNQKDIRHEFEERLKKNVQKREGSKVIVSFNKAVTPVLQDGPSCGLVAVVMAAEVYGKNLSTDFVFDIARKLGFTKQGEMFSALNMKVLVEEVIDGINVQFLDMENQEEVLVHHLINGDLCLIPYDSDFNHEPCNKKGHKAHWALIAGIGLVVESSVCSCNGLTVGNSYVVKPSPNVVIPSNLVKEADEILVYGLQGKSQYPGVWTLSSLVASNRNLVQVEPHRQDDELGFILPEEGIENALCSKALILTKNPIAAERNQDEF